MPVIGFIILGLASWAVIFVVSVFVMEFLYGVKEGWMTYHARRWTYRGRR